MTKMFYLPPLRRFLLPALVILALIAFYRSTLPGSVSLTTLVSHRPGLPSPGARVPASVLQQYTLPRRNGSEVHLHYPQTFFYDYETTFTLENGSETSVTWNRPIENPHMAELLKCPIPPNPSTGHIRLPDIAQNISMAYPGMVGEDTRQFWNPTIISLPYWSANPYLLVSRVVTPGMYQETYFCEAKTCYAGGGERRPREEDCTEEDLKILGLSGGMRCMAELKQLEVPSTPAENCEGKYNYYPDFPGFHDPRVFWSSKGEPLMMVNTHSQYSCFGLWMIDLRTLHPPLKNLVASNPKHPSLGPLVSYPYITELTRNPPSTRRPIEKNWFIFSPGAKSAVYLNYDLSPDKRTFAKLLGHGYTTPNLTDPYEFPCIPYPTGAAYPGAPANATGTFHQATNSLKLILCRRSDPNCKETETNTAFFAVIHKKNNNAYRLPQRYERYFVLWAGVPPFTTLAISSYPIQLNNETATPFSAHQNFRADPENDKRLATAQAAANHTLDSNELNAASRPIFSKFQYTVSIAWAARAGEWEELVDKHAGFLDDEVVLGVGLDDERQVFARVQANHLLTCMRPCDGRDIERERADKYGDASNEEGNEDLGDADGTQEAPPTEEENSDSTKAEEEEKEEKEKIEKKDGKK